MSKNKELVAEAIAAIPLWIAFLDKKEAEQDALLAEMQGNNKTFIQRVTSRLKTKKEQPDPASNPIPNKSKDTLDSSIITLPSEMSPREYDQIRKRKPRNPASKAIPNKSKDNEKTSEKEKEKEGEEKEREEKEREEEELINSF